MKKLFLTLEQATQLGSDLTEYAAMQDSSQRPLFKGFEISFGDIFANKMMPDESFEMIPIPEFTEISKDSEST